MKKLVTAATALALVAGLTACSPGVDSEFAQREQAQAQKKDATRETLEKVNLQKKLELEENPNQIRYVYLMSFAQPIGYYVIKGKVSSSASQLRPVDDVIRDAGQYGGGNVVTDGPKDDGTYGEGDPGNFFFTTDGVMVETSLDYIVSNQPIAIDVPRLGGK